MRTVRIDPDQWRRLARGEHARRSFEACVVGVDRGVVIVDAEAFEAAKRKHPAAGAGRECVRCGE